jgi:probable sporulation protein (polysaccharide deacetylase family)
MTYWAKGEVLMRKKITLLAGAFLVVMLLLQQSKSIQQYVSAVKDGSIQLALADPYSMDMPAVPAAAMMEGKQEKQIDLLDKIKAEAEKRKIAPINAKVDRVWQAIPGYNGLEVDIERTLQLALHHPASDEIQYVMREVSPTINLEDLGSLPIYKGNPKKPMVSLMINVAWGDEFLPRMLETLKKEHVHATFFFDGTWLSKNLDMAKQIGSQGHELSNHAYSHKNMSRLSRQKAYEEISRTQELLINKLNVKNTLFAPPSGDYDQETVQIAAEQKLKTVLWTFDTVDWQNPGASRILQRLSTNVEPGTLILMHPTSSSSQALEGMIRIIKRKGYVLGTVSEMLSPARVKMPEE